MPEGGMAKLPSEDSERRPATDTTVITRWFNFCLPQAPSSNACPQRRTTRSSPKCASTGSPESLRVHIRAYATTRPPANAVRCAEMKEDILEQLVDDFLQANGYFSRHNIKFKPRSDHPEFVSKDDSNHSDIDVLGYHPLLSGHDKIVAVSCKSCQGGFNVEAGLRDIAANRRVSGRFAWKFFRELVRPKWAEAFREAIQRETGLVQFTYVTGVTVLRGDASLWENEPGFSLDCLAE